MMVQDRKQTSWWRWLGAIGLALILLVAALPTLLGSNWVYQPLLDRLEAGNFRLSVGSVQLRWLTPTILRDIALHEQGGSRLLTVREVRTDRGLIGSILSGRSVGQLTISDPVVEIELLTEGSNLSRLVKAIQELPKSESKSTSRPPSIDIDVALTNASVRVTKADDQTVREQLVVVPPFDLSLKYRALESESTLTIDPTELLKEVRLTPELLRLGLDRAIPLLAKSAWFDGRISISTGPITLPLLKPLQSVGTAVITLHEVRSGPSEKAIRDILDVVSQLRGRPAQYELVFVDHSKIDVQVRDERVFHEGLMLGLPKIDPRLQFTSAGSVGLKDRSMNMVLQVPVPLEQLARRDNVRELGVPMLDLPIRGTLDEPIVEWQAMRGDGADLLGLIRQQLASEAPGAAAAVGALEGLADGNADAAITATVELLRRWRESRTTRAKTSVPDQDSDIVPDNVEREAPDTKSNRPVLDALRNVLRGNQAPAPTADPTPDSKR